ncbi:hypothetical protein [Mycoplasmoides genitalium]|uniref:hypothetical protein n=1 Tax=Mycoplasmoides genitalium TaxID=2097 RepID=UPI00027B3BC7|nr:hypothetical protein [Mycoplasmoides genitalium]AFQ02958.1 MgPa adhesin [Mycoplasmoides genitalium M2321]
MLLVPKVVLEYHQLDKVVKESLGVDTSGSTFDPTQRLKKDSPMKDSNKDSEKLSEAMSSMSSGATSPRQKPSKWRWKGGVKSDSLLKKRLC